MDGSAKVAEKTVRYLRINDAIGRLSGSVGALERFIGEVSGSEISKDGNVPESASFQDIYSAAEGRLDEIKGRITDATSNLRELIEG
jgi:hypothetical protein